MELPVYNAKELAQRWRTGLNTVNNLIWDDRLRPMKLATTVIPLFEIERFEKEVVKTQEDLSGYSDKDFRKKYPKTKVETPVYDFSQKVQV